MRAFSNATEKTSSENLSADARALCLISIVRVLSMLSADFMQSAYSSHELARNPVCRPSKGTMISDFGPPEA